MQFLEKFLGRSIYEEFVGESMEKVFVHSR